MRWSLQADAFERLDGVYINGMIELSNRDFDMQTTNHAVINAVDAQLKEVGMPTYSELVALLNDAKRLGLTFDIGTAYIRRSFIDKQTELRTRIEQVNDAVA